MAENKKYFFMKLGKDFYQSNEIVYVRSLEDKGSYIDILIQMYLRSINTDGKLMFSETIPYSVETLSIILNYDVELVEKAIEIFKKIGLIEILEDNTIYMVKIQEYIGNSSTEGVRKSEYRNRIKCERHFKNGTLSHDCPTVVPQLSQKRPPEIEIEKEIDIDIEKEIDLKEKEGDTPSPTHTKKSKKKSIEESRVGKTQYDEHVYLSSEQYKSLINKFGLDDTKEKIFNLNNHKASKGAEYFSDYHTILKWESWEKKTKGI